VLATQAEAAPSPLSRRRTGPRRRRARRRGPSPAARRIHPACPSTEATAPSTATAATGRTGAASRSAPTRATAACARTTSASRTRIARPAARAIAGRPSAAPMFVPPVTVRLTLIAARAATAQIPWLHALGIPPAAVGPSGTTAARLTTAASKTPTARGRRQRYRVSAGTTPPRRPGAASTSRAVQHDNHRGLRKLGVRDSYAGPAVMRGATHLRPSAGTAGPKQRSARMTPDPDGACTSLGTHCAWHFVRAPGVSSRG
jgi:hypothetical protein